MENNGLQGVDGVAMYDFGIVRSLRKRRGWTIAHLASLAGVSSAVISRLERNESRAELETLFRVSRAFGVGTPELLSLAERPLAHVIRESAHESEGFAFREIAYGNVRCLLGSASASGWVSRPDVHADQYELCWCLSGTVRIALPAETHVLEAGSAVQFDAIIEHSYEAVTNCRLLIMHLTKEKRY